MVETLGVRVIVPKQLTLHNAYIEQLDSSIQYRAVYDNELSIIAQYYIRRYLQGHPNLAMHCIWRYLDGAVSHTELP